MGHLSPFTEPSLERYSSVLLGRLSELIGDNGGCLVVDFDEKKATIEFFLVLSLEGVHGVDDEDVANDDGVSFVLAQKSGVTGAGKEESDSCFSFFSRE